MSICGRRQRQVSLKAITISLLLCDWCCCSATKYLLSLLLLLCWLCNSDQRSQSRAESKTSDWPDLLIRFYLCGQSTRVFLKYLPTSSSSASASAPPSEGFNSITTECRVLNGNLPSGQILQESVLQILNFAAFDRFQAIRPTKT